MHATQIVGPHTGRTYEAHDTGQTWNGSPVLAFTRDTLLALIEAGDGADANGYGLRHDIVDVTSPEEDTPVPTLVADVAGETQVLYVPEGRVWQAAA
jgi:hypothetical protein